MPVNTPAPNFALLASLDMRTYSAVEIFQRSSTARTMPTFTTGEGVYEDTLFFLNNRESSGSIYGTGQLITSATFGSPSSWRIYINSSDQIVIESNVDFTVTSIGSSDQLGFGSSTVNAVLSGSVYIATASADWSRGLLELSSMSYRIDEVSGSDTFTFPSTTPDIQDVTTFLRAAESDADDFSLSSLQEIDTAAGSTQITWSLNNDGFIQSHYKTSEGDLTWSSTAIRDLLGFSGNESPVVDGTYSRLTASYHSDAVLFPSRPLQGYHLRAENVGQFRRKIGGSYASNFIGSYVTSNITFDLDARLDERDDYQHFANRFIRYIGGGERINLYQDWGDSRRSLRTDQIRGSQVAYDSLYTSEQNGERGRLRGSSITVNYDLLYPTRLHRRVPVSMEIEHL